jgi:hypothetical protein
MPSVSIEGKPNPMHNLPSPRSYSTKRSEQADGKKLAFQSFSSCIR